MKSLFKAVAIITIFSVLGKISSFLFRIYLTRAIGPESLGVYQIAFSVVMVILTAVSSGLPLTVSRLSAKYKAEGNRKKLHSMVTSALIIGGVSSVVLSGIILIFNKYLNFLFPDSRCVLILLTLLPAVIFSAEYNVLRGVLWGENKYLAMSVIELVEQLIRMVICIVALSFLFKNVEGSLIASISLSISCLISLVIITVIYFKNGERFANPKNTYNEVLKSSLPITGMRLVTSLVQPLVSVIIPAQLISMGMQSEAALTQFGIAMGMTYPLLLVPTTLISSLAMALLPDLASALAYNNKNHIAERVRNSIIFSFFVACICVPVLTALGIPICQFLFGSTEAGFYLQNYAWCIVPICINGITGSILNSISLEKKSMMHSIIGSAIIIIVLLVTTKQIGVQSMFVSFGLGNLVSMLLNVVTLNKYLQFNVFGKKIWLLITFIIPSYIITTNIFGLLTNYLNTYIVMVLCAVICAGVYLLLCELFNCVSIRIFIQNLLPKRKNKQISAL